MKTQPFRLVSSIFSLLLTTASAAAAVEDLHVYLLIGQSNMAGRATVEAEDEAPVERTFLLNAEGEWEPATNPLNRFSSVRKRLALQTLGPGSSFARQMAEHDPEARIGLVVNARGGTRIEEWAPGSELYKEAVRRVHEAASSGELKGILWHQGEGNSNDPEYLGKLAALIRSLREDLGNPALPFVAGQVEGDRPVNKLIAQLPAAVPVTAYASSAALKTFDNTHFDSASTRELGRRYALEMVRLQEHEERVGRVIPLFDGETLAGWEAPNKAFFRVEEGAIVAGLQDQQVPQNQFLSTTRSFRNFELRLKFKLIGSEGVNSGVQFRSWRLPDDDAMIGYQADLGNPGWWGSIYDEHRRNRLVAQSNMEELGEVLRRQDWNDYVIRAEGRRIQLWINGLQTVDYTEENEGIDESGVIGLQIHRMAHGEAWFKDITVEELP